MDRGLDMKLVDVESLYDRSKLIFYFTAPTRIDFRELVKDLVRQYHTRIELRQIGVRHETQMLGALGNCPAWCAAAAATCGTLPRSPSKWPRSRISFSTPPRFPASAAVCSAV